MEFLVVVASIGILAAILVPALTSALERAKAIKDMSNLRQIATLMQLYLNDKDSILPVINAAPGLVRMHRQARSSILSTLRRETFSNHLLINAPLRKRMLHR